MFLGIFSLLISLSYSSQETEPNWICSYCNASDPVIQSTSMLRVHSKGDYTIVNTNTADFLGEVQYTCYHGSWMNLTQMEISLWNISFDTRYGPYAQCYDDQCDIPECPGGYPRPFIGRARADNIFEGQCDPSSSFTFGIWWGLYDKYECKDEKQKIGEDCGWRSNGILKSIDYYCLERHGVDQACDGKAPYKKARDILVKAFESSKETEGGCPNVYPY